MKFKNISKTVLTSAITICAIIGVVAFATPGTNNDPLVSKSYVDNKVDQILNLINNSGTSVTGGMSTAEKNAIVADVVKEIDLLLASKGGVTANSQSYKPLQIFAGQTLIGNEGTEIILRSGSAMCYTAVADGLVDATTGAELLTGKKIEKNHVLIVSRSDGRGITATTNCWVIVRGGYEVR